MGKILNYARDTLTFFIGAGRSAPPPPISAPVRLPAHVRDTLGSLASFVGTSRDKVARTTYYGRTYTDPELMEAYRTSWLAKKIVDIPAFDSFRAWRNWQGKENLIELLEAEEERLNIRGKCLEAKILARLLGGAAIYIGTGDKNLAQPLVPERIGKQGITFLNIISSRDLTIGDNDPDPESERYGKPLWYTLAQGTEHEVRIDPSRLVIFKGAEVPGGDRYGFSPLGKGWGDSVLTATLQAAKDVEDTAANIASLVYEAKVDVISIPDLMASLANPQYAERLLNRFTLASLNKGLNATLMLDKEEVYEQKTASFATLPEVLASFMQLASGAGDIPATRLFGQAPQGMNSTGDSDLRNYYDRLSAMQEVETTPALHLLDECTIRSALGSRPPEVHYIWASLWQISDKERAEIGKLDAETINLLNTTGLLPPEALSRSAINMLVEHAIMPGLNEEVEEVGEIDFEAEALKEEERQQKMIAAAGQPPDPNAEL